MRARIAIAVVVAACGDDPSLRVEFDHPIEVDRTAITVYETETASCADIEFAILDEAQLLALAVSELVVDAGGQPIEGALAGISRTGKKLIVARGLDEAGTVLTAGCVEHLEIVEHDATQVTTVEVATVSIGGINATGPDPFGIDVTLTGPAGTAIAGRRVAWRAFGPAGTSPVVTENVATTAGISTWTPASPACSNADGRLRLRPVPPLQLGGFAFDVRASWAAAPPPLFSSFTRIGTTLHELAPPEPAIPRWCAIRQTATEKNLVCLEQDGTTGTTRAVKHELVVTDGVASFDPDPMAVELTGEVVAILGVDRGGGIRDVYAVTRRADVLPVLAPSIDLDVTPLPTTAVLDAIVLPSCAAGQSPKLLFVTPTQTERRVEAIDLVSGARVDSGVPPVPLGDSLSFNNAGCTTELAGQPGGTPVQRQVVVVDVGRGDQARTTAHFECGAAGGRCAIDLGVPRAGVGFTGGEESRMVHAFFEAEGVILLESVLLPDGQRVDRLVERDRTPAAAFPQRLAAGLIDDDSGTDLVWTIFNAQQEATNVQVAYARPVGEDRLTALSGPQPMLAVELVVDDLTGDGHADVIVFGQRDATGASRGVAVIPAHVPISAGAFMPDRPCEP